MSIDPGLVRAEAHPKVGAVVQRDACAIIDRWAARAAEDQPGAARLHHDALLDHLPVLLWDLGRALAQPGEGGRLAEHPAKAHGGQRWELGWSLPAVVRDYQLLRLVLVEYLEETLGRPLRGREVMAVGVAVDDAVAASVAAYDEARGWVNPPVGGGMADGVADLLGVVGHELRNPLAPLKNAAHLLPHVATDPGKLAWVRGLMDRQLGVLGRLVDDLLDAARVARGKLDLRRNRVDLTRLVRDAAGDRRVALAETGLDLEVAVPGGPVWVDGDAARLAQVLGNLLGNAQKFTDGGGRVAVSLTVSGGRATVAVADTGVGIPADVLPRVFGAYTQADGAARARGGLGLGLALVKGLVEAHGGGVSAASGGPGAGTTVTFWLPTRETPAAVRHETAAPQAVRPRRVLVVDDNPDAAESARVLLELRGHTVSTATAGGEAVEVARGWQPDVVVCDLALPGVDGFGVARAVRAALGSVVRLVCLSGFGRDEDARAARAAGFDAVLVKPVGLDELAAAVEG